MGRVYLATDTALGRQAAVKIVETPDVAVRGRLLREARASARLQHPSIATFYDAGELDGTAFIAMEYVSGPTVRERLNDGPLGVDEAIAVTRMLLEALHHAHSAGLIHRDIKPENVIITRSGMAKLLDFGLAKIVPVADLAGQSTLVDLTRDALLGTPGYMAPEQMQGLSVDVRTDLFGVGALLYEMLAGWPAFPGATMAERFAAVLGGEPLPMARGDVTPEIRRAIARALAFDAHDRYASASAFLRDLGAITAERTLPGVPQTVAVTDLQNLSGSRDDDWIGSGITESVISDLSGLPALTIVPRDQLLREARRQDTGSGAADPVSVAVRLGCRWVVAGSYEHAGDVIRIMAHLVETGTARVLGTFTRDGRMNDIFGIRDELARSMADALNLEAPRKTGDRPEHVGAFECYARGRRQWVRLEKGGFDAARGLYERAVALDPAHARALAGLAAVHALRFTFTTDRVELDMASRYARRALEMQPQNAEAHLWLGYVLLRREQWDEAAAAVRLADSLDPTNFLPVYFLGCIEAFRGRHAEAVAPFQRAIAISPGAGFPWLGLGWTHLALQHGEDARWCLERAVALEPSADQPTAGAGGLLAECLRRLGDPPAARLTALSALDAVERTDHIYRDTFRAIALVALGRAAVDQEDSDAAQAAFTQAILHLQGRPRALGGGHLMVQARAGLARAAPSAGAFVEALDAFQARRSGNFSHFWTCDDAQSLLDLARAAVAVDRSAEAATLLERAVASGSAEATALRAEVGERSGRDRQDADGGE